MEPFVNAVEVWRGGRVECLHRAAMCVVDQHGDVKFAQGDPSIQTFPRSSLKPLQALPLIESGAADEFGLNDQRIAFACASHGGEPRHVELTHTWLSELGLDETHLACGPHPPSHGRSAHELYKHDQPYTRLHNNCSGKHAGMLAVCRHLGFDVEGYEQVDHPLQQMIARRIMELSGRDSLPPPGVDGCSLPNWPIRIVELATIMARLAAGDETDAGVRILHAMAAHPYFVAGTKRLCTDLMTAAPAITVKTGAEGVFIACRPGHGLALALKVEDGATRASEVALMAALCRLGWIEKDVLPDRQRPELFNAAGLRVGHIQAADGW